MSSMPPYLVRLQLKERAADGGEYPFNLPLIRGLNIEFTAPVTFFVGENGTGKSTVIEAIAALCKLPVSGGGRNELAGNHGPDTSSALALSLRPSFRRRPRDAYFLRAEFQAHFASLLDARNADPDFRRWEIRTHATEDGRSIPDRMARPFWRFSRTGFDPGSCCSTSRSQPSHLNGSSRCWRTCPRWWQPASRSSSLRLIRQFC